MKLLRGTTCAGALLWVLFVGSQLVALGQVASPQRSGRAVPPQMEFFNLTQQGRQLSGDEAGKLEQKLVDNAKDLNSRFLLIGYYSDWSVEAFRVKKAEHVLWVIRSIPDSGKLHWVMPLRLNPRDEGYVEAREAWLRNLETNKGNLAVLGNAIDFFLVTDQNLAESLLKEAAALDSKDPRWPRDLGHLYMRQLFFVRQPIDTTGNTRRSVAWTAHLQFERALELTRSFSGKNYLLVDLAKSAFEAGEMKLAKKHADELLSRIPQQQVGTAMPDFVPYRDPGGFPPLPPYPDTTQRVPMVSGDSIHGAHIVLGRVAMQAGNVAEGKQELIKSIPPQGAPSFNSFGPNMSLAKDLLAVGERDVVLEYFRACGKFWSDRGKLQEWTTSVTSGATPNFGANLVY